MKRILTAGVLLFVGLAASAAHADHYQKYFPLKEGNKWTCQNLKFGGESTLSVAEEYYGMFRLEGFPGGGDDFWVAWSGNTLYAWNWDLGAWKPFLRFGAATGTTYTIDLGPFMLSNVKVTVASKTATVKDTVIDQTFYNCVRFTVAPVPGLFDAGLEEFVFAPNVGLLSSTEQSIAGPVQKMLKVGSVNGKKIGLLDFTSIEQGAQSQVPMSGTNKVLVFNTQAAWENFWAQHKPGETAPVINFAKRTVLVALAGQRNTSGYSVTVDRVRWNFPYTSARVTVIESTPTTIPVLQVFTRPCHIVESEKVYSVTVNWKVVAGP